MSNDGGYYTSFEDYGYNFGDNDSDGDDVMHRYVADFETTTDEEDCRVWAWCISNVDDPEFTVFGTDIVSFIEWVRHSCNSVIYFHNLAFDGAFLLDHIMHAGWEWVADRKEAKKFNFTTLISDSNQVYSIELYFDSKAHCTFYDSLKIIPLSVAAMAKAYNLDEGKGSLDYTAYRAPGHKLTEEEMDYIRRDVQIVAKVMKQFLDDNLKKMTAGSNALYDYKQMCGGSKGFRKLFPLLSAEEDSFIRRAYRGGFTYANPKYRGKIIDGGIVFDVNSLYPSVMASCDGQKLPMGKPVWFDGEYEEDRFFPLWVAQVSCRFKIKPNHIPCIQLKGNFRYGQTEYIEDSKGEVSFMVSSVDWDLITQQYNVKDVVWGGGFKFQAVDWLFKDYVNKWVEVKNQATIDGNSGKRQIAKLMLNSLYGKFATRITVMSRKPELVDGIIKYVDLPEETRDAVYLPVGVFITAYARYKTITSAQAVYDRFIYADTDSLHLVGTDIPDCIDVDPVRLGAWKHESTFTRGKFLRAKTYMEEIDGKTVVHVAGMPAKLHSQVTFDNFDLGAKYYGKLYQRRVKGGIVLVEGDMEIRA